MIQEGTALIQLKEHDTGDAEWLQRVRDRSFLKFFPEKAAQVIQAGEIRRYPRGAKISINDTRLTSICIPLNAKLVLRLSAGRIGDEKVLSSIDAFEALGFREVMEGKNFPFSVETEAQSTFVFFVQRVDLMRIFNDSAEVEQIVRLTSSKAVFDFCTWLYYQHVPLEKIRELLRAPWTQMSFEKFKPIQMKRRSLVFIEDGVVQCLSKDEELHIRCTLQRGHWFGGSAFDDTAALPYSFSILEDASTLALDLDVLRSYLPTEIIKRLVREPNIQSVLQGREEVVEISEVGGSKDSRSLESLGWKNVNPARIHKTTDHAQFASTTIWNLLQFFEFEINEKQILALTSSRQTVNLGACAQILEDLGLMTQIVKLTGADNWKDQSAPLVHYAFGRPLLILKIRGSEVVFLDPENGVMVTQRSQFLRRGTNFFLKVSEPHSKQALKSQFQVLSGKPEIAGRVLLRYFLGLTRPEMRNIFIFRLFQSLAVLFVPSFLLGLINQVVGFKKFDYMSVYYIGLGLFIAFQAIAIFMNTYFSNLVMAKFKTTVQPYFYRLFLNQPNNFVTSIKAGFIQSRLQLIDYAMAGVKAYKIEFIQYALTLALFMCVIGFYSWMAATVLLVFCGGGLGLVSILRKTGGLDEVSTAQQRQEVIDYGLDYINGLEGIKLSRSERWSRDRFEKIFLQLVRGSATYSRSTTTFSQIGTLCFQLGSTLALFVVINEFLSSATAPQNAFALSMYLGYCLSPYSGLMNVIFNYSMAGLYPIPGQMIRSEPKDRFKSLKVISIRGDIRFERVSFRYSDRGPFVLNDVSFSAKEGEVVAIVGRSGSGKTTLARLISRQAEISSGKILLDEIDARLIDPACLHSQIGFVSQTPTLFSGTIAQNISLSDDVLDSEAIINAARAANADSFIEKLPGAYNYRLKEGGRGLSGGEKQQIAMARILYSRPHILVLDEATAHLDPKAERLISDKLMAYHGKQTVFVVVQRISTARRADKVIVMKNGRIAEIGEHNKLLAMNGEYAELYRHQVGVEK